jgi:hypothetical protein
MVRKEEGGRRDRMLGEEGKKRERRRRVKG